MYIGVDIGGTKTLVVAFSHDKKILKEIRFDTPKNYQEFLAKVSDAATEVKTIDTIVYGAIGTRGLVDRDNGLLINDNVLGWNNAPLVENCSEIFGCDFSIENDSKLAGLSEANNAGNAYRKVLYMTVSTGIGSAFVVDGDLDKNTIDSEVGKWIFEHEGKKIFWEDFASGKAIVEKYGQRASELEDPNAWIQISKNLALGIVNACGAYTPDLVIIGGGVGTHFNKYKEPLQDAIDEIKPKVFTVPKIIKAKFAEEAVIYGCYELAKNRFPG